MPTSCPNASVVNRASNYRTDFLPVLVSLPNRDAITYHLITPPRLRCGFHAEQPMRNPQLPRAQSASLAARNRYDASTIHDSDGRSAFCGSSTHLASSNGPVSAYQRRCAAHCRQDGPGSFLIVVHTRLQARSRVAFGILTDFCDASADHICRSRSRVLHNLLIFGVRRSLSEEG